ncbi:olfactory receptor 2D2-like [Vombatus ursinus]|uniref:olfactory receptor 2D2-like n=1 Tax=Vombatus ursinus TaxID=29139 RepID=UPI000FFD2B87|nr:olfactory receptor 2D2-like [Vombatus ursinus]XP_027723380.1 olfactory receptor 2D2-like [Vombatus ursinus]
MNQNNCTWVTEFLLLGLSDDPQTQLLLIVLFLAVYLGTVLGSLLLIYLVITDSQLHTPMYFFLCNLSLADLGISTSIVPQALVHMLMKKNVISFKGCAAQIFFSIVSGATQCSLLAVMSYDRYLAICDPMHYSVIMTGRICAQLALGCWICGTVASSVDTIFTVCLPYQGDNKIAHFFCDAPVLLTLATGDTHKAEIAIFFMGVVILLVPVSLVLVSYGFIIVTVIRMKTTSGRLKIFSTCGSHLLVVTLFYGTLIISYMTSNSSREQIKHVAVFYGVINPMLNPLIYSLRNKDVMRAFRNSVNGKES